MHCVAFVFSSQPRPALRLQACHASHTLESVHVLQQLAVVAFASR